MNRVFWLSEEAVATAKLCLAEEMLAVELGMLGFCDSRRERIGFGQQPLERASRKLDECILFPLFFFSTLCLFAPMMAHWFDPYVLFLSLS